MIHIIYRKTCTRLILMQSTQYKRIYTNFSNGELFQRETIETDTIWMSDINNK